MKIFFKIFLPSVIVILIYGFVYDHPSGVLLMETDIYHELSSYINDKDKYELLGSIILVPKKHTQEDKDAIIEMTTRLSNIHLDVLKAIKRRNIKMRFFSGKLTDLPEFSHLKGIQPKGWSVGSTWDDVPGAGGKYIAAAKIGRSSKGEGHGSVNLELHEIAHSVDNHVLFEASDQIRFQTIWKEETPVLFPDHQYFLNFSEEYFAETFAMFYLSEESRTQLEMNAPQTYAFFVEMEETILESNYVVVAP